MKRLSLIMLATFCAAPIGLLTAAENAGDAAQLADAVWKASGGENWPNVKSIDFTFMVEKGGKTLASAEHHWDVAGQTDRVENQREMGQMGALGGERPMLEQEPDQWLAKRHQPHRHGHRQEEDRP